MGQLPREQERHAVPGEHAPPVAPALPPHPARLAQPLRAPAA
jgi:hypothetical protein